MSVTVRPPRLPGVTFEVRPPPVAERLPRMDIPVFVGFAAAGPLHRPVAVEDPSEFAAVFGDDLAIAWDPDAGETRRAHLGPVVRMFFRNGGDRCWVVRVAGVAATSLFPMPALARVARDTGAAPGPDDVTPAFARARSAGSWADALRVSTALVSRPLEVLGWSASPPGAVLGLDRADEVTAGDLVRLDFAADGLQLLLHVQAVDAIDVAPVTLASGARHRATVRGDVAVWLSNHPPVGVSPLQARVYRSEAESRTYAVLGGPDTDDADRLTLTLAASAADAPAVGSLVRVEAGAADLWITVASTSVSAAAGSPPGDSVRVSGAGMWWLAVPPPLPSSPPTAERLTFELSVRRGEQETFELDELGFAAAHPSFWDALPTDDERYPDPGATRAAALPYPVLWQTAIERRFPLAGSAAGSALYVPIGMPLLRSPGAKPVRQNATALERDGLARFGADLFLDARLAETGVDDLVNQADTLRYRGAGDVQSLTGIHAALAVQEATLVAVPDAVHRAWCCVPLQPAPPPDPSTPLPRPEWWHFLPCSPPSVLPAAAEPKWGEFLACGLKTVDAPVLTAGAPDVLGSFSLSWSTVPKARYVLEEATRPDWTDATVIATSDGSRLDVYGKAAGDYYYRVRAEVTGVSSDWSAGVAVRVLPGAGWAIQAVDDYVSDDLVGVQLALLRLCAARGDLFAVLALPDHYREDAASAHRGVLRRPPVLPARVPPPGGRELAMFGYGALYHPWLIGRDDGAAALRRMPPDGAAVGVMACRARERGAWIAPANEPVTGVVALTPPLGREHRVRLQEARVNVIRQEPRGFLALAAETLADDPELVPINVRRLLMLLRRLALRVGPTYVFEPHDDAFRRLVQRGLEAVLGELFLRGAFAGATPETSFQVVTGGGLNRPESVEQGRLIVELRVAPSLPMRFIVVRLVQSGERTLVVEAR